MKILKLILVFGILNTTIYGSFFEADECLAEGRYKDKKVEEAGFSEFKTQSGLIHRVPTTITNKEKIYFTNSSCAPKILPQDIDTYTVAGDLVCFSKKDGMSSVVKCRKFQDIETEFLKKFEKPEKINPTKYVAGIYSENSSIQQLDAAISMANFDLTILSDYSGLHLHHGKGIGGSKYYNPNAATMYEKFHKGPITYFPVKNVTATHVWGEGIVWSASGPKTKKREFHLDKTMAIFSTSEWPVKKGNYRELYKVVENVDSTAKGMYENKLKLVIENFVAQINNLKKRKLEQKPVESKDQVAVEGVFGDGIKYSGEIASLFFFSNSLCLFEKGKAAPKCLGPASSSFSSISSFPAGVSSVSLTADGLCGVKTTASEVHDVADLSVKYLAQDEGEEYEYFKLLLVQDNVSTFNEQVAKTSTLGFEVYCADSPGSSFSKKKDVSVLVAAPTAQRLEFLGSSKRVYKEEGIKPQIVSTSSRRLTMSLEDVKIISGKGGSCFISRVKHVFNPTVMMKTAKGSKSINSQAMNTLYRDYFGCGVTVSEFDGSKFSRFEGYELKHGLEQKVTTFKDKLGPFYRYAQDDENGKEYYPRYDLLTFTRTQNISFRPETHKIVEGLGVTSYKNNRERINYVDVQKSCNSGSSSEGRCCFGMGKIQTEDGEVGSCSLEYYDPMIALAEQDEDNNSFQEKEIDISPEEMDLILSGAANFSDKCLSKDEELDDLTKQACDENQAFVVLGFTYQVRKRAIESALMDLAEGFNADDERVSGDTSFSAIQLNLELMNALRKELELQAKEIVLNFDLIAESGKGVVLQFADVIANNGNGGDNTSVSKTEIDSDEGVSSVANIDSADGTESGREDDKSDIKNDGLSSDLTDGREVASVSQNDGNNSGPEGSQNSSTTDEKNNILDITNNGTSSGTSNNAGNSSGTGNSVNLEVDKFDGQELFLSSSRVYVSKDGKKGCSVSVSPNRTLELIFYSFEGEEVKETFKKELVEGGSGATGCIISDSSNTAYLLTKKFYIFDIKNISSPIIKKEMGGTGSLNFSSSPFYVSKTGNLAFLPVYSQNKQYLNIVNISKDYVTEVVSKIIPAGELVRTNLRVQLSRDLKKAYLMYSEESKGMIEVYDISDLKRSKFIIKGNRESVLADFRSDNDMRFSNMSEVERSFRSISGLPRNSTFARFIDDSASVYVYKKLYGTIKGIYKYKLSNDRKIASIESKIEY